MLLLNGKTKMRLIQLTKGYSAKVDDELFEELNSYSWYASGRGKVYAARRLKLGVRKLIYMHQQVLNFPALAQGFQIDHEDRDSLNNQRVNLIIKTAVANAQNSNRVEFQKGIGRDNTHGTYKAYINNPKGRRINVGTFSSYEDAVTARTAKLLELGLGA